MEVFFTHSSSNNFALFETKQKTAITLPSQKVLLAKRAFDILFAALVTLFLLSWIVPIISLIIKLESRGPAFFKQLRTGKDGQSFYCLKFRSMTVNSSADTQQATKGDSRITRVGAFLRKTSLDELPQFINVLKGEMSVVGPRPHMLLHTEYYAKTIHNFGERHRVLPGITGLAQVSGLRGETKIADAMVKRVKADIHYLENWSLWLDCKIILSTIKQVVVSSEEAY
jgi:putative colanic acid biosynthesis UDP-glucose lipid carrier transferase